MSKIEVVQGDITSIDTDAIVNAANSSLMGGGGVDGAIHRAGGTAVLEECKKIISRQGKCETGKAVITTAGNLPSKYIIHTVGPVWRGGGQGEEMLLANCYTSSLKLAAAHGCRSIAFPNISTGVYGFPKDRAAEIATGTVSSLIGEMKPVALVLFVCFDEENFTLVKNALKKAPGGRG